MTSRKRSSSPALHRVERLGEDDEAPERSERPSFFVIQVTAIASLGGILFGYDLGVISSALPQLTTAFDLSHHEQQVVVSILYVGGGLGAALGGCLCDTWGRRKTILATDVLFGLGALVLFLAPSYDVVAFGRIIVGFAVAVSGIADVSYLHEISPNRWRGAVVSVNEACISLGFLLAFAIGVLLSKEGSEDGWRIMFGVSGLIALLQFAGMWYMPESPKWLQKIGRHEESEAISRRIYSDESPFSSRDELLSHESLPASYDSITGLSRESLSQEESPMLRRCLLYSRQLSLQQWISFVSTAMTRYRRQSYIAFFLAAVQQFCGQTNVLSYAPSILSQFQGNSGWTTLSLGLVKFAVTVIVIWKIEVVGRRTLLLVGMAIIAGGLFLLTIAFGGTRLEDEGVDQTGNGFYLALPGVWMVICGYAMSFGPLTWLLTSEIFPTEIRGRALGASTILTYSCAAVVTFTFLTAQDWWGTSAVFGTYLLVTIIGFWFAYVAIPETGDKTVDEIEEDLGSMLWWRQPPANMDEQQDLVVATMD